MTEEKFMSFGISLRIKVKEEKRN